MNQSLIEKLNPNWDSVVIVNLTVLGVFMLFFKDLTPPMKTYLIPSMAILTMGNGLIGYFQGALFRANFNKEGFKEPLWAYNTLYIIWFSLFIGYLVFRDVI